MELTIKSALSIASLIGAFCTIGVPAVLYSGGKSQEDQIDIASQVSAVPGDSNIGGGHQTTQLRIDNCRNSENLRNSLISFGESTGNDFCGKIKNRDESDDTEKAGLNNSLTDLFQKMGKQGTQNGNSISQGPGKSVCSANGKGGVLVKSGGNGEYLGYCDSSNEVKDNTKLGFLEIDKSDSKVNKLNICLNNCGNEENAQSLSSLSTKTESNGREVEFYRSTLSS